MKKTVLILCFIIFAFIAVYVIQSIGTKPFRTLTADKIQEASVQLLPKDARINLTKQDIEKLVLILNDIVIYNEDNSYQEYDGQPVIYTIVYTDGTTTTVTAYNPFLIIDSTGYQTKYEPCEKLNALGNYIANE